jgi:hypothetical protein
VAKLNHAFQMSVPPQQAREQFQAEVGTDLRRDGGFRIAQDESRRIVYSDGMVSLEPAPLGADPEGWNAYARLRRLLARSITVEFVPDGAGTRVSLRGHATRDMCAALCRLGTAGHWPA